MNDRWKQRRLRMLQDRCKLLEAKIAYLETVLNTPVGRASVLERTATQISKRFGWADGLTEMQRKFVEEYPKDLNGSAAVQRAGYSKNGASVKANQLLKDKRIRKALREEAIRIEQRKTIQSNEVLTELSRLAYSNIEKYINVQNGRMRMTDFNHLTSQDLSCIKEISEQPGKYGTILKVKLYDKMRALNMLANYKKLIGGGREEGTDAEQAGQKVKEAVDRLFGSVPAGARERLPDNVVALNKRLDEFDRKAG